MNGLEPQSGNLVPLPWWVTETFFWLSFCLASFISLSLFYGQPSLWTFVDLGFEAFIGALCVRPIPFLAPRIAALSLAPRLAILGASVILLSQAWNLVRMLSFPVFFPGAYIWNQYGGWAFSAILIFAAWTALYYGMRAYKLAANQRKLANEERFRRLQAEQLSSNAQLKMLRYQINPHFIFNTLNSINALVATERNSDARRMIEGFSGLLRRTLVNDPPLIVPLADEIDTIERYLQVEQMRFGDRLTFTVQMDPHLGQAPVPSLILQPLVENAVKHGVEAQTELCDIRIEVRREADGMRIVVADTGQGLRATQETRQRQGIGVENVKARLESVYGSDASFVLANGEKGGVEASLVVPLTVPEAFL